MCIYVCDLACMLVWLIMTFLFWVFTYLCSGLWSVNCWSICVWRLVVLVEFCRIFMWVMFWNCWSFMVLVMSMIFVVLGYWRYMILVLYKLDGFLDYKEFFALITNCKGHFFCDLIFWPLFFGVVLWSG